METKAEKPKSIHVGMILRDAAEVAVIDECAERAGMNRSGWMRWVIRRAATEELALNRTVASAGDVTAVKLDA